MEQMRTVLFFLIGVVLGAYMIYRGIKSIITREILLSNYFGGFFYSFFRLLDGVPRYEIVKGNGAIILGILNLLAGVFLVVKVIDIFIFPNTMSEEQFIQQEIEKTQK